jgi:hypothetical protein
MTKELVKEIMDREHEYVDLKLIKSAHVHIATVQELPERKQINGIWIDTGRKVQRATLYFLDGTFSRTKSKHIISAIGAMADNPVPIDNGFAVFVGKDVAFMYIPTEYANGEIYDVISMKVAD